MTIGISEAIGVLNSRILSLHVHDNHGTKDEHLWPGDGAIDWPATTKLLAELAKPPAVVLEPHYTLGDAPGDVPGKIQAAFEKLG
jgi:sugar phosphate isomerase/epimerase